MGISIKGTHGYRDKRTPCLVCSVQGVKPGKGNAYYMASYLELWNEYTGVENIDAGEMIYQLITFPNVISRPDNSILPGSKSTFSS